LNNSIRGSKKNSSIFWIIAFLVGIISGLAAVLFRWTISSFQELFYQADEQSLVSNIHTTHWMWFLIIPVVGSLTVGLVLYFFCDEDRNGSVADVIEGAALNNGRVDLKFGATSTIVSLITLTTGGSTGREGPVVHLAGIISTYISNLTNAQGISARDLLGCAVAAAVSASFNAPIAGALFALEVVLRHFAIHAFAPIAISSVAGTIVGRLFYGNVSEFSLQNEANLEFYLELPAFILLGIFCGLVAVILVKTIFRVDELFTKVQKNFNSPIWLRTTFAGLLLGLLALQFPHIIGVGYETTSNALIGSFDFNTIIILVIIKMIAVIITIAGRMGGGIFSPSLMIGALTGLAFGLVATSIFPTVSGSETLYALAGMGAVAASVLGAPISTVLIVFELTGNWQVGLVVMVTVSVSTSFSGRLINKSFFLSQLKRRKLDLISGSKYYLLRNQILSDLSLDRNSGLINAEFSNNPEFIESRCVLSNASLETTLRKFDEQNTPYLFVIGSIECTNPNEVIGIIHHIDLLKIFNKTLTAVSEEEHS